MTAVRVVLIVLGANAVVWGLVFAWFKWQAGAVKRMLDATFASTGECLLIGPERGYYNVMKARVSAKTMGIIALTDRRLIFNGPLGMNADIPFDQIADTSRNKWWQGNYRNGREFMILRLRDGTEVAFQVKNLDRWMQEIQPKLHG